MKTKVISGAIVLAIGLVGYSFLAPNNEVNTTVTATTTTLVTSSSATASIPKATASINMVSTKKVYALNLNSSNTVLLLGEINDSNALDAARELQEKKKHNTEVYLLINSPGGNVLSGLHVVNVVENANVNTICIDCASMASIIFEHGKTRYVLDRGIIMFHNASGSLSGSFNQIRSRFMFFDGIVNKLNKYIAARAGVNYDIFKNSLSDEIWLDGADAIERGYADKLVMVSLNLAFNDKRVSEQLSKINVLKDKITVDLK